MITILSFILLLLFFAVCQHAENSNNTENNQENAERSFQIAVFEISFF